MTNLLIENADCTKHFIGLIAVGSENFSIGLPESHLLL